jgi:ornithine carbamoyltransferase
MTLRHITKMSDLGVEDLNHLLERASEYREKYRQGGRREDLLGGRVVALVFEKPSLRTKVTFEVATLSLGGFPVFLSSDQIFASGGHQHGRESVPDIGRNLERFCDLIVARVFRHETIEELASVVRVPVVNALCDRHHPCQAVADVMTMELMARPAASRMHVAYVGDGNNVATSLVQACAMRGHDVSVASPAGYEIPAFEREAACDMRVGSEQKITFSHDPAEAVSRADVIYTDTFVSMGQESDRAKRLADFAGYQVNDALLSRAPSTAVFMHCLPAHRGEEVTDEVMDSERSVVFEQAENRLHVAKAVVSWCLRREPM